MISIRDLIHAYAVKLTKTREYDRSQTVGASEIGQCARQTWFAKHGTPRDAEYAAGWGAQMRGNVIEDAFWVPALRATLPEGVSLLFAGEDQRSIKDGYLSATTDGLLVWPNDYSINLDCKSIDPRSNLPKEKAVHSFQVQAQMGLIRGQTKYKPEYSIISYINASFWDDITEFAVPFDPKIYAQAHRRATQIMEAHEAAELPPEGKMAGGSECKYCAWASHCADVTVIGVPHAENQLSETAIDILSAMRDNERMLASEKEAATSIHARAVEDIKQFLRDHNTRSYRGDGWSVAYSVVSGRATLDIQAIEAAGIDLSPFYKTGRPAERLTVK